MKGILPGIRECKFGHSQPLSGERKGTDGSDSERSEKRTPLVKIEKKGEHSATAATCGYRERV